MSWLVTTGNVLYQIVYGIAFVLGWIIYILLYILHWVVTPVIRFAAGIKYLLLLPLDFLARFEVSLLLSSKAKSFSDNILQTICYFVGCAILIGVILGFGLHFLLRLFSILFKLDRKPRPKPESVKGHTASSYRAARNEKKQRELERQKELALQARLVASQPLVQAVVREARRTSAAGSNTKSKAPASPKTTRGSTLMQETILEHTDEEDDSAF
jgi:hypothetical protein